VVVYGHPAGAIGNALLQTEQDFGEKIPPLNALIVNAKSGIPGSGCDYYLKTYLDEGREKPLSYEQQKSMAEETMEEVWRFQKWEEILDRYGVRPVKRGMPSLRSGVELKKPRKGGWSNEPESEAHQALKQWVARNPQILKSRIPFGNGHTEWLFASADRVDVLFSHADGCMAAEVKASNANDADLERGIYQCIKYQALLRAELKAESKIPNGSAILITERQFPLRLQNLADLLGVRNITVDPVTVPFDGRSRPNLKTK